MKLKFLAAAAALLCGVNAYAGINIENNAEVFGVVYDEKIGTYAVDFGITWKDLLALQGPLNLATVTGSANWGNYIAADTNRNDFSQFEGTRWAIYAADSEGFNFIDGDLNFLTTSAGGLTPKLTNEGVELATYTVGPSLAAALDQNGLTPDPLVQGDAYNALGSPAHFIEFNFYGQSTGFQAGNAIGTDLTNLYSCTTSGFIPSEPGACTLSSVQVAFDGVNFTATAPIPEPGTYALLLAGLATVGFMARRRRT